MNPSYSITEARKHLRSLLDEVERGSSVEITRRGRPVAVLVPPDEAGVVRGARRFSDAYSAWRATVDPADLEPPEEWTSRSRDPGR